MPEFTEDEITVITHAIREAEISDIVSPREQFAAVLRVLKDARDRIAKAHGDRYGPLRLYQLDELIWKIEAHEGGFPQV